LKKKYNTKELEIYKTNILHEINNYQKQYILSLSTTDITTSASKSTSNMKNNLAIEYLKRENIKINDDIDDLNKKKQAIIDLLDQQQQYLLENEEKEKEKKGGNEKKVSVKKVKVEEKERGGEKKSRKK